MTKQITGIKKRQQIKKANKTMFWWIVVASATITICLVLVQFLVKQLILNQRVISTKGNTNSVLIKNKESFESIKNEVNKLSSDANLSRLKVEATDTNLQVVIDALPTSDDRVALATSLQQVLLARSGVGIVSLSVTDASAGSITSSSMQSTEGIQSIKFSMVITGNYDQIRSAIGDMERSIRPISIDSMQLEGSGNRLRASIVASTYYQPAVSVELKSEVIKP